MSLKTKKSNQKLLIINEYEIIREVQSVFV